MNHVAELAKELEPSDEFLAKLVEAEKDDVGGSAGKHSP